MLSTLSIENIALIDKLELTLDDGLNILSGETGAGKSIIIDSLNFVLGERADKTLIRYGTEYAIVQAVFSNYENYFVKAYLEDIGVDIEEILVLRRKMSLDGKNECRINGKPVTLSMLKGLTELLVDIHGQHQHQSLLKVQNHINLLDMIGGSIISEQVEKVKTAYEKYQALKKEFAKFGDDNERARKIDLLSYQVDEISKADVYVNEEEELLEKRKRVRNLEKILEALNFAKNSLDGYESSSVSVNLKNTITQINTIAQYDQRISNLSERLENSKAEIIDISETFGDMLEELNFDSNSADEIENRLEIVRNIQRKYGGNFEALTLFYNKAKEELAMLENATEIVLEIEKEISVAEKHLVIFAKELTNIRQNVANKFEKAIIDELNDLGMAGSTFKVDIVSDFSASKISDNGADLIEFLISANKGEPLKPLAKIISGGEMSRFMLALKNIVADIDGIQTMVFDEIDTGISGKISAVVSEKMCNISRNRQVIAVTHMPSLAAMADSHFLIKKYSDENKTYTEILPLEDDTDEIARLIGGSDYSSHAVPHAKEMKAWANKFKKTAKGKVIAFN